MWLLKEIRARRWLFNRKIKWVNRVSMRQLLAIRQLRVGLRLSKMMESSCRSWRGIIVHLIWGEVAAQSGSRVALKPLRRRLRSTQLLIARTRSRLRQLIIIQPKSCKRCKMMELLKLVPVSRVLRKDATLNSLGVLSTHRVVNFSGRSRWKTH